MKTEKQIEDKIEEINNLEKLGVKIKKLGDFRNGLKWVLSEFIAIPH